MIKKIATYPNLKGFSLIAKAGGFSLIEVLVTLTILTLLGVAMATILTRSFNGNTKTELIGNIKQNGQAALAIMEKDIRESETAVCPITGTTSNITLLTKTDGKYIRLTMIPENGTTNGYISREELVFANPVSTPDQLCVIGSYSSNIVLNSQLIDNSSKTAISLKLVATNGFTVVKNPGFKDTVKIQFDLGPGVNSGAGFVNNVGGTTNSVNFQTTIQIR